MAIRAVIFDYGMVLSTAQEPAAHANLLAITGLEREIFEKHYWRYRDAYDMGTLNGLAYWKAIGGDAGLDFTSAEIERLIENDVLMWSALNAQMLAWVTVLHEAGFRIGILSNIGEELLRYMRQEFGWLGQFDHHTWSCELGIAKPDPAIYTYTCEKLDVAPADALFLDDKPENIAAAESIGLNAIQFRNVEQLRKDLAARGLLEELPVPGEPVSA